jgi:hypothetical protein
MASHRTSYSELEAEMNFPQLFAWRSVCYLLAIAAVSVSLSARGEKTDEVAQSAAKLPIKRIVLFSSGVGYFQHEGKVDGNATIDLKFRVENINDLLKSMILEDRGGGQISTVTYGSRDPITKTLKTFSIDLTTSPSLGQLLSQIRGEQIEIEAPNKVVGTIVGIEKQKRPVGEKQVVDVELLNLLTDAGLRRIPLDSVGRIRISSAELDAELHKALEILATSHAKDKKTVSLKFLDSGQRDVRVGYIQESPVWKTSYRLVLDEKGKPFLQGWAIVENTTDTDWSDVRLSLVSGRPISFTMDLYSPLYAPRPNVIPEFYASLNPQMYEQNLAEERYAKQSAQLGPESEKLPPSGTPSRARAFAQYQARHKAQGVGGGDELGGGQAQVPGLINESLAFHDRKTEDYDVSDLQKSIQAAARGGEVGELFQYDIQTPVSLPRLRSAMLPIINDSVEGKKLSIYNQNVDAKHPLNGFELKNTSKLHLMQGPVTVFDGGVYAGDARIPDLPPGAKRLLSYAMDLDVEVAPTNQQQPQHLITARIEKGVLLAEYKQLLKQTFAVKNSGHSAKTVLIEVPINEPWKLVEPKEPSEKTRDMYRFAVTAKPNEHSELKVQQEPRCSREQFG